MKMLAELLRSFVRRRPLPPVPADAGELAAQALAAYQRDEFSEAERLGNEALCASPGHADALSLLGIVALRGGRMEEATRLLARAAQASPRRADVHNNLGIAQRDLRRFDDALRSFEKAIAIDPASAHPHNNLGTVLLALERREAALDSFERALALDPSRAEAHFNRANALAGMGRFAEALESYDRAIALSPGYAEAFHNRGNSLDSLGRYDDAIASYEQAIALEPANAGVHFNKALSLLVKGDYSSGWATYEWRWKTALLEGARREFSQPLWLGREELSGKTILLHAEQGLGDTLQFCRYAPLVAARGATVLLEVQPPLKPLLEGMAGVDRVLARGEPLPPFDCHCPLLSLPLAFGTTVDSIPAGVPYVAADGARIDAWRERLAGQSSPRIGLAWTATRLTDYGRRRSIALPEFLRLLPVAVQGISLQKDATEEELATLGERNIPHFGPGFADTAALIALMDVVVSVDTSIAHLAGAMGKPVWILMPHRGDWRWMERIPHSPWYPTARLFRQPSPGDWASVLREVNEALQAVS